jgi:predicted RecA/RadA family phage recombinase
MAAASGYDSLSNLRTAKYTNGDAVTASDVIVANNCVLVAVNTKDAATENVYIYAGKVLMPKEAPLVISVFAPVFWDAAAGKITTTSAGNTPCGYCVEGAESADTTIWIMLTPNLEYITAGEIGPNAVTPIKMGTRTLVALGDEAAAPTIAQLMTSSLFTITPTAARTFTTPTAVLIVAGISGATVGTWFDFTVVNLGNFPVTLTAGDGDVTLSGNAVINKGSATFRAVLTNVGDGTEALTIYRTDGAVVAENIPVADAKILIGDVNGLAAAKTPSGAVTMTREGVFSLTGPSNPLTTAIADPGAAGAIPVTGTGSCPIVTAGAEARTLAIPSAVGQLISLCMKTDNGDATITVAEAINQAGNTQIVMGDVGDTILLVGVDVSGALRWRVVFNDGCTLGP